MGLDISYYEFVELVEHEKTDGDWCSEHEVAYHIGFPLSFGNLVEQGCYEASGEVGGFRAGSYGGYGAFREALWEAATGKVAMPWYLDKDEAIELPFFLLVNFADNEGCIGPDACRKLADQFKEYRESVRPILVSQSEWWGEKYDDWQHAFETAADTGMVSFH